MELTPATRLEVSGLHVDFKARGAGWRQGRLHALSGVDLAVGAGATVGIVGESGCGKSTLARSLVGLQRPTAGTVRLNGKDLWAISPRDRRRLVGTSVGVIFQDPTVSLNRRLPVFRILRDPLDVHERGSRGERMARVAELMRLVGLPESAATALPGQLSGGQRQRVAIARALALDPQVVVADEPTSALDVSVRAQILNLLLDLRQRLSLTMVYISHDIQTVRRVSDRVITMYLGHIVEEAPAAGVGDRSRHPYTRALLSATPSLLRPMDPIRLDGPIPSAVNPPSGCPFHTRCWRKSESCTRSMPAEEVAGTLADHRFRCFHPVEPTEGAAPGSPEGTPGPTGAPGRTEPLN